MLSRRKFIITNHYITYAIITFVVCVIFIIFSSNSSKKDSSNDATEPTKEFCNYFKPAVKIFGIQDSDTTLDIVKDIFAKMGYTIHNSEFLNWDVMWSFTYPFRSMEKEVSLLKPYQKINHFPGSGFLTQKKNLIKLPINRIPKSFILPDEKKIFMKAVPMDKTKSWMIKSYNHREVRILSKNEELKANDIFIQEFISNPLLINEKKFDIGVYVILTSIDPLRVYVYSGDILLRFCKQNYYPLYVASIPSYVVGDDYLPIWEIDDLKFYYSQLNYTAKESLNAYLYTQGKDANQIWSQIYETIQDVYTHVEINLVRSATILGNLRNYFEMVRFDFMVDEDINIHLLEVNMSPNLSPAHFSENRLLYEQIVFNTINIAGLTRKFHNSYVYRGEAEVSEKDIQVFPHVCSSDGCNTSCKRDECMICNQCMNLELKKIAISAYLEFMNKGKYKRLLPAPTDELEHSKKEPHFKEGNYSRMNKFMQLWFQGKCLQDVSWCH